MHRDLIGDCLNSGIVNPAGSDPVVAPPFTVCHGCPEYRPAKLKFFVEASDDMLVEMDADQLRIAYRMLRSHHIEETTVLKEKARRFPEETDLARAVAKLDLYDYVQQARGIRDHLEICEFCNGFGTRMYSNASGWRGGIGGAAMSTDVCDQCWGSGTMDRPWRNLRDLEDDIKRRVAEEAVNALARSCAANTRTAAGSVKVIIQLLDTMKNKRKINGVDINEIFTKPLTNELRNLLARAIGEDEVDWFK